MDKLTAQELDKIKHDDLRKFAIDEGIDVPEEIKTKRELIPFLLEQLQSKEQDTDEEVKVNEVQVAQNSFTEVSDAANELGVSSEKSSDSLSKIEVEEPDKWLGKVRYIDTQTAAGTIRYDRETHSSTLIPHNHE